MGGVEDGGVLRPAIVYKALHIRAELVCTHPAQPPHGFADGQAIIIQGIQISKVIAQVVGHPQVDAQSGIRELNQLFGAGVLAARYDQLAPAAALAKGDFYFFGPGINVFKAAGQYNGELAGHGFAGTNAAAHAVFVHGPVPAVQFLRLALCRRYVFLWHKSRAHTVAVGGIQAFEVRHAHGFGSNRHFLELSFLLEHVFDRKQFCERFIRFKIVLFGVCFTQSGNTSFSFAYSSHSALACCNA